MNKNVNKNRKSPRAPWWDYGNAGAYFITICTKNRAHYFGKIVNGGMILSTVGIIADILWYEIPNHAQNLTLGEFVVMPNHIHGILILNESVGTRQNIINVGTEQALSLQGENNVAGTGQAPSLHPRLRNPSKNTVSSIIGGYKSAVSKHANRLGFESGWQLRFHDHIIRNDAEYTKIANYIINNPMNWKDDKFYL